MINSITYDKNYIQLYKNGYFSSGFFEVDSISLLIGKNGSGKTRLLRKIALKVANPNSLSLDKDFNINYSNKNGEEDWGCVYFSPVKNSFTDKNKNPKYEDASLSFSKKVSFNEIMANAHIFSKFNIHPRLAVTAKNPLPGILDSLIEISLEKDIDAKKNNNYFFSKFKSFYSLYDFTKENINKTQESHKKSASLKNALIEETLDYIFKFIPVENLMAYFFVSKNNNKITREWLNLLHENLNYFLSDSSYNKLNFESAGEVKKLSDFLQRNSFDLRRKPLEDIYIPVNYPKDMNVLKINDIEMYFKIELMDMSSGQIAVINQIISIQRKVRKLAKSGIRRILILIDEGDAFLHLEWQQLYIFQLNNFLGALKREHKINELQVIIATHSPLLATDLPKQFVCNLDSDDEIDMAFASPMHLLLNKSFSSKNIGEFASSKINAAVDNLKNNTHDELDKQIVDAIDNEVLKKEVIRLFGEELEG